jgi:phage baseplate assembly protein gpV
MSWAAGNIAVGFVSTVHPETATVRVRFPDREDLVSAPLQVGMRRAGGTATYAMPSVDEHVVCLLFGTGIEAGVILCSLYDEDNLPPVTGDVVYTQAPTGDFIAFHLATGQLVIQAGGGVAITGDVLVTGSVTVTGDVTADGISLTSHTHSGVEAGMASTGQPQ